MTDEYQPASTAADAPVDTPDAIESATPEGDQGPALPASLVIDAASSIGLENVGANLDLSGYAPVNAAPQPIYSMEQALALPVTLTDEGTLFGTEDPRAIVSFKDEQRRTFHVVVMPDGTLAARPFVRA